MRLFALELNNDIKGIIKRKEYIEYLISQVDNPDFVVLPELALCSYMASKEIWRYTDNEGIDTSTWAVEVAKKYNTYIGVGYLDKENGDYYNRYLIANKDGVCGVVTKSEGEAAVFKRGKFDNIIKTPLGNIAVAICYDSRRKHFYDNIKDKEISLILFPHGAPFDPKKGDIESKTNYTFCNKYVESFNVPVIYVNSKGKLEYMPGKMGAMMAKAGFTMNGKSKIYAPNYKDIDSDNPDIIGADIELSPHRLQKPIHFYGNDLIKGNWLFRLLVLKKDIKDGILMYENDKKLF
jgi:predicted amidohydrolase